jgi:ferredoxin-NADP reductase
MKMKLIEKREEAPDVTSFIFEPETAFSWEAGQLLHYTLPHENEDDRGSDRYFTISTAPFEKHVAITTRFAGEKTSSFKQALFGMEQGAVIEADGLEGDFTVQDTQTPVVFIAGGIGITPFRSILLDLDQKGLQIDATLLYANRNENIVFKDELEALAAKHPQFTIKYFIDQQRINEEAIKAAVTDLSVPVFYVSGPKPMVKAFETMMKEMGIADERIKRDFFPNYEEI